MSRRKLSAVVCLALALFSARVGPAQETRPAPAPKPSKLFREARAANENATPSPEAFEFEIDGFAYRVSANGNGRRAKGKRVRGFNLRLDGGEAIVSLLYSELEGDLLLLLHTDIAGIPLGFVTRLEQPSMRGLWRQRIPAGEVGDALREGHSLYVTGLGLVGKLDLRTGTYDWQHDDLEVVRADWTKPLHTFDEPELDGGAVLFRERPVYNPRRTLVLDKKTGEVIRIE